MGLVDSGDWETSYLAACGSTVVASPEEGSSSNE